jgi:hypothetical protein
MNYHRPPIENASKTSATRDQLSNRRSYIAHLFNALRESRRLQAARIIHQYRHLLQEDRGYEAREAVQERKLQNNEISKGSLLDADQY